MTDINNKIRLFSCAAIFLLLAPTAAYSQGTDIRTGKQKHFFIGIALSPAKTNIVLSGGPEISRVVTEKKTALFGSLEIGYSFSKIFGLSTGFRYSAWSNDLSLVSYSDTYKTIDSELEQYNRRINGSNIKETPNISFLSIPLSLDLHIPFSERFGIYIQSGISYSIPVQKSFSSLGTFSYSGYYSAYNVVIENVPFEGFLSNYGNKVNGSLKMKSSYIQLITSAGLQYNAGSRIKILMGGFYDKILSDISGNPAGTSFSLSTAPGQMKSFLQGSTNTKASALGIRLTLRFYL
jgi:hypothetical protein